MSTIHSNSVPVGISSRLMTGTARFSTLKSRAMTNAGSASTASPVHSRRPARGPGATDTEVLHAQSPVIDDHPALYGLPCPAHRARDRCRSAVGRLSVALARTGVKGTSSLRQSPPSAGEAGRQGVLPDDVQGRRSYQV